MDENFLHLLLLLLLLLLYLLFIHRWVGGWDKTLTRGVEMRHPMEDPPSHCVQQSDVEGRYLHLYPFSSSSSFSSSSF